MEYMLKNFDEEKKIIDKEKGNLDYLFYYLAHKASSHIVGSIFKYL